MRELEYAACHVDDGKARVPRLPSHARPFGLCELQRQTPGRVKKLSIDALGCLDLRPIMYHMPRYLKIDELTVYLCRPVMCLRLHRVPTTKLTLLGLLPLLDAPCDDGLQAHPDRYLPDWRPCRFDLPASLEELRLEECGAGVFNGRFLTSVLMLKGAASRACHAMPSAARCRVQGVCLGFRV